MNPNNNQFIFTRNKDVLRIGIDSDDWAPVVPFMLDMVKQGFVMSYEAATPYYSFDSIKHENRYIFIELLKVIKAKFKLDEFQKRLIDIYSELIKKMLKKQIE